MYFQRNLAGHTDSASDNTIVGVKKGRRAMDDVGDLRDGPSGLQKGVFIPGTSPC